VVATVSGDWEDRLQKRVEDTDIFNAPDQDDPARIDKVRSGRVRILGTEFN